METLIVRLRAEGMALAYARLQLRMACALLNEARALSTDELDWDDVLIHIAELPLRQGPRELLERKDLTLVEEAMQRPRVPWRLLEAVASLVQEACQEETGELLDALAEAARLTFKAASGSRH